MSSHGENVEIEKSKEGQSHGTSSGLEEPEECFVVGAKKVEIYKMIENGQWQQMSQGIQGRKG